MNDATAEVLSSLSKGDTSKTPEQVKVNDDNKAIVASVIAGLKGGGLQDAYGHTTDTSFEIDPSGYDTGYTRQQGNMDKFRAGEQGGWDNFGNRLATAIPNIGLGIVELAGHIIDTPEQIWGLMTNGQGFNGEPNDFDNAISKWARETSEDYNENFVNYRKDPEAVFDWSDPAAYIDAAFDTAESITEFMATGFGTAKLIGGAGKLIGTAAKSAMKMDMLGAGIKAAERAGKIANSAITSSSVASLNAAQTFESIYKHALDSKKDDGTPYTDKEAREIAAVNAADTYRNTLLTATALNYTSLAPFAGKASPRIAISGKPKTINTQIKALEKSLKDKKAIASGEAATKWYQKQLNPGSIAGEMLQEGVEEVTENISSGVATINAKRQMGQSPESFDLFSAENAMAFTLGALGGGMAKGIGSAYKKATGADNEAGEYEQYVTMQIESLKTHQNLSSMLSDLKNQDASKMSNQEYTDTMNKIFSSEVAMVSNAVQKGLDDGTIAMMELDIDNMLNMKEGDPGADLIDKPRLQHLKDTITKHRKMVARMSNDPTDHMIQRELIQSSLQADLVGYHIDKSNADFTEALDTSAYKGNEVLAADKVNKIKAYEVAKENGDLTDTQEQDLKLMQEELAAMDLSDKKIKSLENAELQTIASSIIAFQAHQSEMDENRKNLGNSQTAEDQLDKMRTEASKQEVERRLAEDADMNMQALDVIISESDSITAIETALNRAKASLNSKYLSSNPEKKAAMKATIDALEEVAKDKIKGLKDNNAMRAEIDSADPQLKDIAGKVAAGTELDADEQFFAMQNKEDLTRLSTIVEHLNKVDEAKAEAERQAAEQQDDLAGVPGQETTPDVSVADVETDESIIDLSNFGGVVDETSPASDKVATESSPTKTPDDITSDDDKAAKSLFDKAKEPAPKEVKKSRVPRKTKKKKKYVDHKNPYPHSISSSDYSRLIAKGFHPAEIEDMTTAQVKYALKVDPSEVDTRRKRGKGSRPKSRKKSVTTKEKKNSPTPIGDGEFVAYQRQIKYYFFVDKNGEKIKNDLQQVEAAKEYLKILNKIKHKTPWDEKKIGILISELKKVAAGKQSRVWLPKLSDGIPGVGIAFEENNDLYYINENNERVNVPVTEIFESEGGYLLINTPSVNANQRVEIAFDPDWKYYNEEGAEPIMIYRIDKNGKRLSSKPIAEVPFSNVEPGSMLDQVRKTILADKNSKLQAVISFKGNGEIITETNPDGTPVFNNISATQNSNMPLTIAIVSSEGKQTTPNRVSNRYNPEENKAIEKLNKSNLRKSKGANVPGTTSALMVSASGDLIPANIRPKQISQEIAASLTGVGTSGKGLKNIAEILHNRSVKDVGGNTPGQSNLKKLVPLNSIKENEVDTSLIESIENPSRVFYATPNGVLWKDEATGDFIRVDTTVNSTNKKTGISFVSNPLNQMLNGKTFSVQRYQLKDGRFKKVIAIDPKRKDKMSHIFSLQPGSSEYNAVSDSFKARVAEMNYNIHSKSVNNPLEFTDAWGLATGMTYNEYLVNKGIAGTDVTNANVKIHRAGIRIRLVNDNVQTNPVTDQIVEQEKPTEDIRVQIAENDAVEESKENLPEPTKETPVPDKAGNRALTPREIAARMIAQNDPKTRSTSLGTGMKRMSKHEVAWLVDQIGEEHLNLIKGIDRIFTIGGKEAFGWYHQSMITLASEAETGTAYHEGFHFVFNMALNSNQRKKMLKDAKDQYGNMSDLELEEKLAEDFRSYMLEPQKQERKSGIRRFFDSLISYIENIIGLNPSRDADNRIVNIGNAFSDIKTGKWKSTYKAQFGNQIQPKNPLFREVGDLSPSDEQMLITTAGTEIINAAMSKASHHQVFGDILSNKKGLKEVLSIVRAKFEQNYSDNHDKAVRINDAIVDGHMPSYEEAVSLHNDTIIADMLKNWNLSEEQKRDNNPPPSFEEVLIESMATWGMQVSIKTSVVEDTSDKSATGDDSVDLVIDKSTTDQDGTSNEQGLQEGEDSSSEHLHNQDSLLKDPKKTMGKELLLAFSTLEVLEIGPDKKPIINKENGGYKKVRNMLGSPTFFDMNEAFDNVKNVLADKRPEDIIDTIDRQASLGNPLFIAIKIKMDEALSQDGQSKERFDSFISSFMSTLNNATYDLITIRSAKITDTGSTQFIFANKANSYQVVNKQWKSNAQSLGLVDHEMKANIVNGVNAWDAISDAFNSDVEALPAEPNANDANYDLYEAEVRSLLKKHLGAIGLDITDEMLIEAQEDVGGDITLLLYGQYEASLEAIIKRGKRGVDKPFGKSSLLNIFSKPFANGRIDISGGATYANGKQYHSVNMPSHITETISDIKSANGFILDELVQDQFYVPDPNKPELTNMFLELLSDPEFTKDMTVAQLLDFKDGKDSREYINTNFEDSLIQKIAAGSYSEEHGYFSVGTLSDKLKSMAIKLPLSVDLTTAKIKLKDAYKRTMYQEMTRIRKINESTEFKKRYKNKKANTFLYLPELNGIESLTALISQKEITPSQFNEIFNNEVLPAIEAKIENDLAKQIARLADSGVLVKKKDGSYTLSKSSQQHLGIHPDNGVEAISKFIIEDGMWKMEMSKVFMGDIAKYDGYWDYFKRMYQTVTPGRKAYVNPDIENASNKEFMTRLNIQTPHSFFGLDEILAISDNILTDPTDAANAKKYLTEIIENREPGVNENEDPKPLKEGPLLKIIQKIAASNIPNSARVANTVYTAYSYRSNNRGDAQTYVSIDFFRDQKKGLGQWSKHYEWIYQNAWVKGITVEDATKGMSDEDANFYKNKETQITADVLKPFYYGQRLETIQDGDKSYTNVLQEQYKESMAPILPIWGKKVSGFDWMLKQFDNEVDAISTEDTVKVGNFNNAKMVKKDKNGNLVYPTDAEVLEATRDGIPTRNLRYPQVPAKMKDHAIAGTQLQKIIMSNLSLDPKYQYNVGGKQMSPADITRLYNDAFSKKIEMARDKVAKELSIDSLEDASKIASMTGNEKLLFLKKLKNIVKESVISEAKSKNLIDALHIITIGDNNYDYDLGVSFDAYSRQYQNIVTSLIGSNILRQQISGGAMINMADLSVKPDDRLKFLRKDPETGRTLPAEIAMPHVNGKQIGVDWGVNSIKKGMENLPVLEEDGTIIRERLTKEQKEALDIVVYRIPTQMKSSAVPAVIKRIMPASDGAKMMIPGEMTTQAGLDFDFDKSFMIMRSLDKKNKEGEVESANVKLAKGDVSAMSEGQLNNTIFDVHWSVLTDPLHFEEIVTPVSSKTHDQILSEMEKSGNKKDASLGDTMDVNDVFSTVSNIEMESLAKYSHIMRGTFSKFAGGHNVMTSIALMAESEGGNINKYINIQMPVEIESKVKGYKYDRVGRQRDSSGILISDNHSENLNSALDSQKDPKLGKLNTSVFNSFATGYMLDLGVPEITVKRFMNTEVMKDLSKKYFQLGGTPDVMYDAVKAIFKGNGLGNFYSLRKSVRKGQGAYELSQAELVGSRNKKTDIKVLLQFLDYHGAGGMMSKLNDLLSPDTQKISDAAGIRVWDTKKDIVINDKKYINVNEEMFQAKGSPLSKLASYHVNGINYQKEIISGLFPYFSPLYNSIIDVAKMNQKAETYADWKMNDTLHSITDSIVLKKTADKLGKDILDMASSGFRDRVSLYTSKGKQTIVDRYDYILNKYPDLKSNMFMAYLVKDEFNYRNATQLLTFPNISDSTEAKSAKNAFQELLDGSTGLDTFAENEEVKQFARDFVAYTVGTSGFTKNSHSAIMVIPSTYWSESGIASLRREANKYAQGESENSFDTETIDVIMRHIGPTSNIVPSISPKDAILMNTTFNGNPIKVINLSVRNSLVKINEVFQSPRFIKVYNPEKKTYQLYQAEDYLNIDDISVGYVPVDTYGEFGRSHEIFEDYAYESNSPSRFIKPEIDEAQKSEIDAIAQFYGEEIESQLTYIPTPSEVEGLDSGMYSANEMIPDTNQKLNIEPDKAVDQKAAMKGNMSNKYIGFAEGLGDKSSTGNYAKQVHPSKVNTGEYLPSDTVFVSVPGKRGGQAKYQPNIDATIIEVQKALDGGALIVTDNAAYTEGSDYNVGEKQLKVYLETNKVPYNEITENGTTVGVWGPVGDPLNAERANDIANEEVDVPDTGLFNDSKIAPERTDGLSAIDPDEDIDKPLFALNGTGVVDQMSDAVETKLNGFLENNNISTTIVDKMEERFGVNATGAADALNQAIYLAKGESGRLSKPEEVAHIYIESTLGTPATEAMIAAVEGTQEYEEVKKEYGELYNNDDYRLRREAAAKILAKHLVDPKSAQEESGSFITRVVKRFLRFIKNKFGKMSAFHIASEEILDGVILNSKKKKKGGYMFDVTGDSSDVPLDHLPDPDEDQLNKDIDVAKLEEMRVKKIQDDFGFTEEEVEFAMSDLHKTITSVSAAVLNVSISLKRKMARLKKQSGTSEQIKEIDKIYKKINATKDIGVLVEYLEDVQAKILAQGELFNFLLKKGLLTNQALMEIDAELKSYDNIKFVNEYVAKNMNIDSDLKSKLHESIGRIAHQRSILDEAVSEQVRKTTSKILHALTSQKLSIDQVIKEMDFAPKDVSFISKWIRPGADSADLLVRMTQKTINDAKQYAWMEFMDMYRGPMGLEQANRDYEDYLRKNGELNSDMEKRNEPFITLENGKWFLVNPENGKEKYDALMAMSATDPRRKYYDTLVQMYIGTQEQVSMLTGKQPLGYQLPRARKKNVERILGKNDPGKYSRSMKELLTDTFLVRGDDNEEGLMRKERYERDENNEVVKDVPLYYTSKMEADDISLDISTTIGASVKNMLEYNRLGQQKGQLWAMEKIANERQIIRTETTNSFIGKVTAKFNSLGQRDTDKGRDSNSAHQIQMIKDQHYYGETDEKSTIFTIGGKEFTWNKLSKFISKVSSSKMMILNPKIAISNAFTGEAMLIQEAISGRYFNMTDWRKGGSLLAANYGKMVAEIYSRKKTSKMGGLIEFLNLDNQFETAHRKLGMKGSLAGNMYEGFVKSARIMQDLGQVGVDIQTVGAVSNNIKVQDADGNEMSFYEAFDMVEGKMKMKEGLTYEGKPLDNGDGTGQMYMLRERIIKVSEGMHGVYNKLDAPAFAAKVVGQQVMFMRGWLFSQMARRFDKLRYQERLGEFDEGSYTSLLRTVANVFATDGPIGTASKFKALMGMGKPDEAMLTQEEIDMFDKNDDKLGKEKLVRARQANVKKSWAEMSMIAGMYLLGLMIFDDDEEKGGMAYEMYKYQYYRLSREIFFYRPDEFMEIIKNPSINRSTVSDALGIAFMTMNFPEWSDEVSSGAHKGDNKLWHRTRKYVPGWNQWKALEDLDRSTDAMRNGFR